MSTVLLVDRQASSRRRLVEILLPHNDVFVAPGFLSARRLVRSLRPQIIVVSTSNGDAMALALFRWLASQNSIVPTVVMLGRIAQRYVGLLVNLGVTRILPRCARGDDVRSAVADLKKWHAAIGRGVLTSRPLS